MKLERWKAWAERSGQNADVTVLVHENGACTVTERIVDNVHCVGAFDAVISSKAVDASTVLEKCSLALVGAVGVVKSENRASRVKK